MHNSVSATSIVRTLKRGKWGSRGDGFLMPTIIAEWKVLSKIDAMAGTVQPVAEGMSALPFCCCDTSLASAPLCYDWEMNRIFWHTFVALATLIFAPAILWTGEILIHPSRYPAFAPWAAVTFTVAWSIGAMLYVHWYRTGRLMPFLPRFSLKTLLIGVTVFGCWLGYQLNWIRQRREILDSLPQNSHPPSWDTSNTNTRWGLWLLGEKGITEIRFSTVDKSLDIERIQRAVRLFPEARVIVFVGMMPLSPAQYQDWKINDKGPSRTDGQTASPFLPPQDECVFQVHATRSCLGR
jgi:hypothetical protein